MCFCHEKESQSSHKTSMRDAPFGSLRQPLERDGSNHEDSRGSDDVNASTLVSSHFESRVLPPGFPLTPILIRLAFHRGRGGLVVLESRDEVRDRGQHRASDGKL
jgi:hypothetical protein